MFPYMTMSAQRWLWACLTMFGVISSVSAQVRVADSLQLLLKKSTDPKEQVDLMNDISYRLYDFNDSLALDYAKHAYELALGINYTRGLKSAYNKLGIGYFAKGDFREALRQYQNSLSIKVDLSEEDDAYSLQMIGKLKYELAEYDSALFFYKRALALPGVSSDAKRTSTLYRNMAQVLLMQWKNEEAFELLKKAEALLTESSPDDAYLFAELWTLLGIYYETKLDFKNSEIFYNKMCALANKERDYFHLIKCQLNQTELAYRLGNYPSALASVSEALELSEQYTYPPQLAEIYLKFAEIYADLSQHEIAVKYHFEVLRISEKIGLRYITARSYADLSWIFMERKDYERSEEYIRKAQAIREGIGDRRGIGNCYNVLGLLRLEQKKISEAIPALEQAYTIWSDIGHEEGVSAALFNLSLAYIQQNQLQRALDYQLQAIEVENKVMNEKSLGVSYNILADLLLKMKRYDEAKQYLDKARTLANITGSLTQKRSNHQVFAAYYAAIGDHKSAFKEQSQYILYNDSIYRDVAQVKMAEMEALYKVDQKEKEIELLNQQALLRENEMALQESQLKTQRSITWASVTAFVLISALAYSTYRYNRNIRKANASILEQKEEIQAQAEELTESNELLSKLNREVTEKNEEIQAQSEELIEANQTISQINLDLEKKIEERTNDLKQAFKELDTFFYRSSHDFRRPLTTFLGLAEVANITVKDQNALELFAKVKETAHNLDKMLVKLQSISDVGAQHLVYKEVLMDQLFEDIKQGFEEEIKQRHIRLEFTMATKNSITSYPALVRIILENLIENAIHFCGVESPHILIMVTEAEGEVEIRVTDNGQGISREVEARIFDMYFRGNERSKGNGLGLYIVKKAVEKLYGRIRFETKLHQGTTFIVNLPMSYPA